MSWLHESWNKTSEKNGQIEVRRSFGKWEVRVNGTGQTTDYTNAMWRDALGRIPASCPIHRVLVLGVAGAGTIKLLKQRFPECVIDCIEWDPVMIEIFDHIKPFQPYPRPNIMLGDAYDLVPKLEKQYDLILLDLFTGSVAAHDPTRFDFFKNLIAKLKPQGFLLANVFKNEEVFSSLEPFAVCSLRWKYKYNALAIFQPLPNARIGDTLPAGYRPFRAVRGYLEREAAAKPGWNIVGEGDTLGLRWHVGPFWFEDYTSDSEPKIEAGPRRTITWNRIADDSSVPNGWKSIRTKKLTGLVDITDGIAYDRWSPHARRHLDKWHNQQEWEIIDVTFDEFLSAYKKTSLTFLLKHFFLKLLRDKYQAHGKLLRCFGARRIGQKDISAGFAALDITEAQQSIHLVSFILPEAKPSSAGVGLVDRWFTTSKNSGIRFCDFDIFWTPGNPASWEGFSRFKSQFNTQFVRYPEPLERRV